MFLICLPLYDASHIRGQFSQSKENRPKIPLSLSPGDRELRSSPLVVLSCFTPNLQFPPRTWLLQYSYHVGYPTKMLNQMLFLQNLDIPICLGNSLKALFSEHPLTYHPVQEGTLSSAFNHTFKGNFSMGFKGKLSFSLRPCFLMQLLFLFHVLLL